MNSIMCNSKKFERTSLTKPIQPEHLRLENWLARVIWTDFSSKGLFKGLLTSFSRFPGRFAPPPAVKASLSITKQPARSKSAESSKTLVFILGEVYGEFALLLSWLVFLSGSSFVMARLSCKVFLKLLTEPSFYPIRPVKTNVCVISSTD